MRKVYKKPKPYIGKHKHEFNEQEQTNFHRLLSRETNKVPLWHVAWVGTRIPLPGSVVNCCDNLVEPSKVSVNQKCLNLSYALVHDEMCAMKCVFRSQIVRMFRKQILLVLISRMPSQLTQSSLYARNRRVFWV